jgi:hypothetical protein
MTCDDLILPYLYAFSSCDWSEREGDVSEYVVQIAPLRIDHAADFGKLIAASPFSAKTIEQSPACRVAQLRRGGLVWVFTERSAVA